MIRTKSKYIGDRDTRGLLSMKNGKDGHETTLYEGNVSKW
jgi:hypothetical protein